MGWGAGRVLDELVLLRLSQWRQRRFRGESPLTAALGLNLRRQVADKGATEIE